VLRAKRRDLLVSLEGEPPRLGADLRWFRLRGSFWAVRCPLSRVNELKEGLKERGLQVLRVSGTLRSLRDWLKGKA
jgi:hypothetical protein